MAGTQDSLSGQHARGGMSAAALPAPPTAELPTGELLLRRLEAFAALGDADRAALPGPEAVAQIHEVGTELEREGASLPPPRLLVAGWACRMRVLPDGRRQILGLVLPGDCVGLPTGPLATGSTLWTTLALTRIRTVGIERLASVLRRRGAEHTALVEAFAAIAAVEQGRLVNQVVSLGRRTAVERVADLLLDIRDRLATIGIGQGNCFPCPLTQEVMADLLGLSTVHVNRTLQRLRRDHLLVLRSGQAELPDPESLAGIADYDRPRAAMGLHAAFQGGA